MSAAFRLKASALPEDDLQESPRNKKRGRARESLAESSGMRSFWMLAEMMWLTLAMTVQSYTNAQRGYLIDYGMLIFYVAVLSQRSGGVSASIWILSLGLALGTLGGLATGDVEDINRPLHMGLCALAVVGVFVSKYNRAEDARLLAAVVVVLLPIAVRQSIVRNGLAEQWQEGSRYGINLSAFFLMLGASYCFLLKIRWVWLSLAFYFALLLIGSRTALFSAIAFLAIYAGLNKEIKSFLAKNFVKLILILLVGLVVFFSTGLVDAARTRWGQAIGTERFDTDLVKAGWLQRVDLASSWLITLFKKPTFFGQGIYTYAANAEFNEWPHNGILHAFNGLGVICGFIYLWFCIKITKFFWQTRGLLTPHLAWAGALFVAMLLGSFCEARLFVQNNHIAGFAVTYGSGLAIWAAEQFGRNKVIRENRRPKAGIGQTHTKPAGLVP